MLSVFGLSLGAMAASWRIDASSLSHNAGRWVVSAAVDCEMDRVIGVAVVVYSRKQLTMAWGHSSLRTIACEGGRLRDLEYETYRLSAWNERALLEEHEGEPFATPERLAPYRGALVLFRNEGPVEMGWYGDSEAHNREIYELWLDLPDRDLAEIVAAAEAWYEAQRETLREGGALEMRYRPLSTNCTTVLTRLLASPLEGDLGRPPPHLPFARMRVLHPSHALVARWEGLLPGELPRRPRPVFRWRGELPEGFLAPTEPELPGQHPSLADQGSSAK